MVSHWVGIPVCVLMKSLWVAPEPVLSWCLIVSCFINSIAGIKPVIKENQFNTNQFVGWQVKPVKPALAPHNKTLHQTGSGATHKDFINWQTGIPTHWETTTKFSIKTAEKAYQASVQILPLINEHFNHYFWRHSIDILVCGCFITFSTFLTRVNLWLTPSLAVSFASYSQSAVDNFLTKCGQKWKRKSLAT